MEDLETLLEDLGGIGLKSCLREGMDFGWGMDLGPESECDGLKPLFLTEEAIQWMHDHGHLPGSSVQKFSLENNSSIVWLSVQFSDVWMGKYKMDYTLYQVGTQSLRKDLYKVTGSCGIYKVTGSCGDSGFGKGRFQYHLKPRSVASLQKRLAQKLRALTISVPTFISPKHSNVHGKSGSVITRP